MTNTNPAPVSGSVAELLRELREELALRSMMDDPLAPLLAKLDAALSGPVAGGDSRGEPVAEVVSLMDGMAIADTPIYIKPLVRLLVGTKLYASPPQMEKPAAATTDYVDDRDDFDDFDCPHCDGTGEEPESSGAYEQPGQFCFVCKGSGKNPNAVLAASKGTPDSMGQGGLKDSGVSSQCPTEVADQKPKPRKVCGRCGYDFVGCFCMDGPI